jgi:formate/nitrite transporter FocA (FNT family)
MMADISPKQIRSFFYAIEVNLLFWIAVVILVWRSGADSLTKMLTIVGFFVAAGIQHVAYYNLYKQTKGDG